MNAKLLADADSNSVVNSDENVEQSIINQLKYPATDFVLGQFKAVDIAGKSGGFTMSNTGYKNAVDAVDQSIGKIVAAIEGRETYAKEKWLIIVCSP
jgi:bisphosphoglycerate-independent phosphoglycerate mutase (AlkP superfamily)